jgi:hypothetical protein
VAMSQWNHLNNYYKLTKKHFKNKQNVTYELKFLDSLGASFLLLRLLLNLTG